MLQSWGENLTLQKHHLYCWFLFHFHCKDWHYCVICKWQIMPWKMWQIPQVSLNCLFYQVTVFIKSVIFVKIKFYNQIRLYWRIIVRNSHYLSPLPCLHVKLERKMYQHACGRFISILCTSNFRMDKFKRLPLQRWNLIYGARCPPSLSFAIVQEVPCADYDRRLHMVRKATTEK